nr:glucose-6-phosphate isomerase 1, chloroplastic [Tanacetum cinerariifolium]
MGARFMCLSFIVSGILKQLHDTIGWSSGLSTWCNKASPPPYALLWPKMRLRIDHNDDDDDLANERDLLASLIEKLKCEIDDSKNRHKFLETSNKVLFDKLKELDRRNDVKYVSKVEIDCAKAKGDLLSDKIEFEKSCNVYTQKINDLNQTISHMKKELFVHQETISILSQAKAAQIKLYKTREDKELDKVIALENKVKVLDNIVYKAGKNNKGYDKKRKGTWNSSKDNKKDKKPLFKVVCYKCGDKWHIKYCYKNPKKKNQNSNKKGESANAVEQVDTIEIIAIVFEINIGMIQELHMASVITTND